MPAISQLDPTYRAPAVPIDSRGGVLASMAIVAGGTLVSRVLGMLRDMATASLLGLSGGVLDALIVAFRIPNLFRALFGEGALATCYVPLLAERRRQNSAAAWQLTTAVCFWLVVVLAAFVLAGEALCGYVWFTSHEPRTRLLVELSALLLPYVVLVCLAAQLGATLQTYSRFTAPALAPALVNVLWLLAAWLVAPAISQDAAMQARVLAVAILVAGGLQLTVLVPGLRWLGFRIQLSREASRETLAAVAPALCPAMLGLAVTRINTLCDSLFAWVLAAPPGKSHIEWLGSEIAYPLEPGAAGALYCAERLCHLPVGLLGLSIAGVIFPRLSRLAAGGDRFSFGGELTFGLRLVLLLGVPASAGLWLLSEPLIELLFARGEFTAGDVLRTAHVVRCYSVGVWACCALPVLLRAYYAFGDRRTPLRVGLAVVALNLTLNVTLIWHLEEAALPLSTSICAAVQCLLLVGRLAARLDSADWQDVLRTLLRCACGTAVMYLAGRWLMQGFVAPSGFAGNLVQVASTVATCMAVYAALLWRLERSWLCRRFCG
jgi:putative peptidoglycan lipid II flippase